MKGVILFNKYYTDSGMEYIFSSLSRDFLSYNIELEKRDFLVSYGVEEEVIDYDFALFFDKDIALAKMLEDKGVRVFNSSSAIEICDDKEKTYQALNQINFNKIPTILSPLAYDNCKEIDIKFIDFVESKFDYPMIAKECSGSQGRQVYLINSREELEETSKRLLGKKHIFQKYIECDQEEDKCMSQDTRVYVVGEKVVFSCNRYNTTSYKSNIFQSGSMKKCEIGRELKSTSIQISQQLGLDYCAIDYIKSNGKYYFVEANSNAYFRSAEECGAKISKSIVEYILCKMK